MAEKRMFTQKIIDSDAFLEMPLSAQALYFHLNMRADDDGFVNNPKRIARIISASEDDLKILLAKRFIIGFESGVIVIKHWRMHNTLKSDRYHPTDYQDEFLQLRVKPNKAYTDRPAIQIACDNQGQLPDRNNDGTKVEPERNQNGTRMEPENRLGLGLEKDREEESIDLPNPSNPTLSDTGCLLSDDNKCGTGFVPRKDVRRVMEAWNALGLTAIKDIKPDTERGRMVRKRLQDYGIDAVLEAIRNAGESDFLQGKNGKFQATFDWFIRPNNFQKTLEGNYRNGTKTVYQPDSEPYRGARYLAKLLRKRLPTLPEYQEETLQKWAAALDELHGEGHDWDEISDVMNLSQRNEFWQRQICDAYALKRKYVNLLADLERG